MKVILLHCHFYQPPRENPFTGEPETEPSAFPFRNWNERITAECYSRIADLIPILSCNWGPTLLAWLKNHAPEVYIQIVSEVKKTKNAVFQPYYHVILPLCCREDRKILSAWGIKAFELHFGHRPLGVWLPELAVDLESLRILKSLGVKFAVLRDDQIEARRPGVFEVEGLDGFFIVAFDHKASGALAFSGEDLYEPRAFKAFFAKTESWVLAALDGETFGHHKKNGILALKALRALRGVAFLNANDFFQRFKKFAVRTRIIEKSSWSCPHGVLRWMTDCGCSTGLHPGWNQRWREPLRKAVDWLSKRIGSLFTTEAERIFRDPQKALEDFVFVIEQRISPFLFCKSHLKAFSPEGVVRAMKLLEMKRMAFAMQTSCGWFFDDISGLESCLVLRFAAKVIELAYQLFHVFLEAGFTEILSRASSNATAETGKEIYERVRRSAKRTEQNLLYEKFSRSFLSKKPFKKGYFVFEPVSFWADERLCFGFGTAVFSAKNVLTAKKKFFWVLQLFYGKHIYCVVRPWSAEYEEKEFRLKDLFRKDIFEFFAEFFSLARL